MSNKLNIEEIKYLIPDYVSGLAGGEEKIIIENALKESAELREFYEEVKGTFEFVSNVKFEEPPAHYFNNLLPRIHEKIEERGTRKLKWSNFGAIWKIIIPVAAVLLIFIVYMVLRSPENQMTKKEIKPIEEIKKDSPKTETPELKDEKKEPVEQVKENVSDKSPADVKSPVQSKKNIKDQYKEEENQNTARENSNDDKSEEIIKSIQANDEFAAIDPDDITIFAGNTSEGIDEETDTELGKLNNNEKDQLIEDLLKSNL